MRSGGKVKMCGVWGIDGYKDREGGRALHHVDIVRYFFLPRLLRIVTNFRQLAVQISVRILDDWCVSSSLLTQM